MKKAFCVILVLLGVCPLISQPRQPSGDYILLLNSANFSEAWSLMLYHAMVDEVGRDGIPVDTEELLVPTMRTEEDARAAREALLAKYPVPPRLAVYIGDPGWIVTRPLFDSVWKDVPTLICYSRDSMPASVPDLLGCAPDAPEAMVPTAEATAGYNLTILRQPFFVRETIDLMRRMMPRMQKVALISDHRYISRSLHGEVERVLRNDFPDLGFESLTTPEITTEKLLDTLTGYDDRVGVIYYSWFLTKESRHSYLDDNVQNVIFGFSRTPVFTLADREDESSGHFAGGHYIPVRDFSREAIAVIRRILDGEAPRDIPFAPGGEPGTYLNYHHLEHHGIDPGRFPDEAVYAQAPPGFFQENKVYIVIAVAVLGLLGAAFFMRLRFFMQRQAQRDREYRLLMQYRRLVDNMPVIYIRKRLVAPPPGRSCDFIFKDVNPAFERVFGCRHWQVVNRRLSELVPYHESLRCFEGACVSDSFVVEDGEGGRRY